MHLAVITSKTLPEAWYLAIRDCMDSGKDYTIGKGSFENQKRRELDFITIKVEYPKTRPLIPDVPLGVPPVSTMQYVEDYLPYLMTSKKKENEEYTYGEYLESQIEILIKMYRDTFEKTGDYLTNQACMTIGDKNSINQKDPPCLRLIDTKIREGKLSFEVYFRSWDLWAGFPSNLAAIQLLKEYIVSELGVEDGELIACSKGLHLYNYSWPLANIVLRR